jgi:hypothetical protein
MERERCRQVDGYRAFADAALAGEHDDFMPDAAKPGLQTASVRIRFLVFILFLFLRRAARIAA